MTTQVLYNHNNPPKKYIIKTLTNGTYNVCGFVRINTIWRQTINKNMNGNQLQQITCRRKMPVQCNASCQL